MKKKGIANTRELSIQAKEEGYNIPYTTVRNFYNRSNINVQNLTLSKLSEFLNCSVDYLSNDTIPIGHLLYSNNIDAAKFDQLRQEALKNIDSELTEDEEKELAKLQKEIRSHIVPVLGVIPAGIPLEAIEEVLDYEEISKTKANER